MLLNKRIQNNLFQLKNSAKTIQEILKAQFKFAVKTEIVQDELKNLVTGVLNSFPAFLYNS